MLILRSFLKSTTIAIVLICFSIIFVVKYSNLISHGVLVEEEGDLKYDFSQQTHLYAERLDAASDSGFKVDKPETNYADKFDVARSNYEAKKDRKSTVANDSEDSYGIVNILDTGYLDKVDETLLDPDNKATIPFLKNYVNPCWYSKLPRNVSHMYEDNLFQFMTSQDHEHFIKYFLALRNRLVQSKAKTQFKCLPYFYLLGLPKCGTTDFYYDLGKHPQVQRGKRKEYHWWNKGRFGKKMKGTMGDISLADYIELFDIAADQIHNNANCTGEKINRCITGEASVSTMWNEPTRIKREDGMLVVPEPAEMIPKLMYNLQPGAKLMVILRNPITRCYSDFFYFNSNHTKDPRKFHEALVPSLQIFKECFEIHGHRQCTHNITLQHLMRVRLYISMYYTYVYDWLQIWPKEQLHVVKLEEYSADKGKVFEGVTKYLGIDPFPQETIDHIADKFGNRNKGPNTDIWPETKNMLLQFFQPYNDKLAKLLGDNRFRWL